MTGRRFVVWFARSAIIAFSVTTAFVGCSRQGEGERCDFIAAGDTDCDDGLECVRCVNLVEGIIDRCCPKDAASDDDRCRRSDPPRPAEACPTGDTGTGGTTGSGGTAGSGGMSGSGGSGTPTGGTSGEGGAPDSAGAGGA